MTLAASATFIFFALNVPASIIDPYKSSIKFAALSDEPLVIFFILVRVFTLSPGFTLSGL